MLKLPKKYPSTNQWRQFFKILNDKEKVTFLILFGLFLSSFVYIAASFYLKNTEKVPAKGGRFIEGVVGQPRFINPIYAQAYDVDRDLVEIIFSGLVKYDSNGKIVPDLAKNYEISEDGKTYNVYLKDNLFWSDGQPLTAEDVIFTIEILQNSDYKSPVLARWLGINVEKIADNGIRFTLRNPYGPFLENLTQKIIPKHIFKDIPPENFPLTPYNLKPVGSGPYKFKNLQKDNSGKIISLELVRNPLYFGNSPNLSTINFKFYDKEEDLIQAYHRGEITGFSLTSLAGTKNLEGLVEYSFYMPRYFAVFFNPEKSKVLSDKNVREALNYGTNKTQIIEKILSGRGRKIDSPLLPELYGFSAPQKIYEFNVERAKEILENSGFLEKNGGPRQKKKKENIGFKFTADLKQGDQGPQVKALQECLAQDPKVYPEATISGYFGDQTKNAVIKFQEKYKEEILLPQGLKNGTGLVSKTTREKLNEVCFKTSDEFFSLKFSLSTVNQPLLIQTAQNLKEQWEKLGAEVNIELFDASTLEKDVIKQRNYESLLFGNVLTMIPDVFAFWHSSQTKDPGLNLSFFQSRQADRLLEDIRQKVNDTERMEKLATLQEIIIEESPAVFLYNPDYLYFVAPNIKGINTKIIADPAKRFSQIENWYIKTKRVWK
jgi:peptide/nickel transport system substrate-binding protein